MTEEQLQQIEATVTVWQPNADYGVPPETYYCRDVPTLVAEVRRLRRMVDDSEILRCFRHVTKTLGIRVDDMIRMEGEIKQLDDTIRRLHKALNLYGNHLSFCGQGHCSANPCTCGFTEALINQ